MPLYRASLLVLFLMAVVSGCGPAGSMERPEGLQVSGKITLPNGTPLGGGTLILRPEAGIYGATAIIQADGSFKLADTSGLQEVVPGRYQVFVSFPNPSHAALAKKVNRRYQESDDVDSDVSILIEKPTDSLMIKLNN
jgi:hypothetical protein